MMLDSFLSFQTLFELSHLVDNLAIFPYFAINVIYNTNTLQNI